MKKYQFLWLALPLGVSVPFMIPGCAGTLTPDEIAQLQGSSSGAAGSPTPTDCGLAIMAKDCPKGSTWSKCQSCSNSLCHGTDAPVIPGFDLSSTGIGDGTQFIGKPASTDMAAACSPMSMPPATGQIYIDKNNPENSLIYKKVTANFGCGSQMPFAVVTGLTTDQQACILNWIKHVPGVNSSGGAGGSAPEAGASGTGGGGSGQGGSGGAGGAGGSAGSTGTDAGKGGGPTDAGKG